MTGIIIYGTALLGMCAAIAAALFQQKAKDLSGRAELLRENNVIGAAILEEESKRMLGWAITTIIASLVLLAICGIAYLVTRT